MTVLAAAKGAGDAQLVLATVLGIAVVVLLITWLKVHPFLALILGSAVLGVIAGVGVKDIVTSFTAGVGSTVGSVGSPETARWYIRTSSCARARSVGAVCSSS